MSVRCEKCGADISWENEDHDNCETVQLAIHLAEQVQSYAETESGSLWALEETAKSLLRAVGRG